MKKKIMSFILMLGMLAQFSVCIMAAENDNVIVDGICYSADMKKIVSWTELFKDDSFTVPDGVTEIGEGAFSYGCPIKKITIADSVEIIAKDAFYRSGIESVFVGKNSNLSEIGENAFGKCYNLRVIFLPQNIEKIDVSAFTECNNLSIINIWQSGYADSLAITPGNLDLMQGITATDARLALRISARLENETKFSVLLGDVNRDGKITAVDARTILRISARLE